MSKPRRPSAKRPSGEAILVSRSAWLKAMALTSQAMQAMGDEIQAVREDDELDPEVADTIRQIIEVHLQNLRMVSMLFQDSLYDHIDPDGTRGRPVN